MTRPVSHDIFQSHVQQLSLASWYCFFCFVFLIFVNHFNLRVCLPRNRHQSSTTLPIDLIREAPFPSPCYKSVWGNLQWVMWSLQYLSMPAYRTGVGEKEAHFHYKKMIFEGISKQKNSLSVWVMQWRGKQKSEIKSNSGACTNSI